MVNLFPAKSRSWLIASTGAMIAASLILVSVSLGGIWEIFVGGARRAHLLSWLLAGLCFALIVLLTGYLSSRNLHSEALIAHDRLLGGLLAGHSVAWDLDVKTGRDQWFGDLKSMFGLASDAVDSRIEDFYRRVHPEDRVRVSEAVLQARNNHSSYTAEFRVVHADGIVRWVSANGSFHYGKKGEPVRMLGIATDITEQKKAHEILAKSEEKFFKTFRASPVAMTLTSAKDHRYLEVNETFEEYTGWPRDEIIGRTPFDLNVWVDPAGRETFVKRLLTEKSIRDFEVHYRRKNGSQGVALSSAEFMEIDGEPAILSAIVDITYRKRAENALHLKQAELAEAQRLAHLGSWKWDPKTMQLEWSEELFRVHGLDPNLSPPSYEQFPELFTPESWNRLRAAMADSIRTGNVPEVDLEVVYPDRSRHWVSTRGYAVRDSNGEVVALRGTTQDITDRKRTAEQLRQSQAQLAEIVSSAMDAIISVDQDRTIVLFNAAAERMLNCPSSEAMGTKIERFIPETFSSRQRAPVLRFGETGSAIPTGGNLGQPYALRLNGDAFPIEASVSQSETDGKKLYTIIIRDITERIRTEETLRESEEKFRRVVEHIEDAVIVDDVDGRIIFANDRFLRLFGFTRDQLSSLKLEDYIAPEYRTQLRGRHTRRIRGETLPSHFEYEGVRTDARRMWLEVDVVLITDKKGKILGTQSAIRDITERKQAIDAIHASELRLRHLIETSNDWVYEMDRTGAYTYAGPQCRELLGYEPEEMIGKRPLDFVPADEIQRSDEKFRDALARPASFFGFKSTRLRKDGRLVVWETNAVPMFDKNGEFCGYRGMVRDITDRDRAEQALRESEERFRFVANEAPVLIWTSGTDKLYDYFNNPWLEFTGRPLHAELGYGWTEGVHPEDSEGCLQRYTEAFERREPFEMQYRLRRHDGEYRWILDKGIPRSNPDGSFAGYIGSCVDITERKLAEEAMATIGRRLIEAHEEERTWIGRELHDDINQRLALLAVELDQWKQSDLSLEEITHHVSHAQDRITHIAKDVQALSHRLHSSKLEYLGLATAVNSFCRELSEQSKVRVHFTHSDVPRNLPKEISLCLFRVVQEALQNAVKHSGVKDFAVDLSGTPEAIELTVTDMGRGFEEQEAFSRHGLGLISMRERLQLVQGEFSIRSKSGIGTTVYARVPLKVEERQSIAV